MKKISMLLLLWLFVGELSASGQGFFNPNIFKVGVSFVYSGSVYKTAYTPINNHDTSYDVHFDMRVLDVFKKKDTVIVILNNFFNDVVFADTLEETKRILIFTPKTVYINKTGIAYTDIAINKVNIKSNLNAFNILFTEEQALNGINARLFQEFKMSPRKIVQELGPEFNVNVKKTFLRPLDYTNRRITITSAFSYDIGFWNYIFDFSGGKAVTGEFSLERISFQ